MKILIAHNQYQQGGGEDQSVAAEVAMLESYGHEVFQYRVHNDSISQMARLGVAARTIWNQASYRDVRRLIQMHRPDVTHFNNTFPLISPAAYYASRAERIPVVQSLRNYRLLCPGAYLLRDGKVCESCLGKRVAMRGVVHGCYRGGRAPTAVVAAMLTTHKLLRTWNKAVDVYIALTDFGRQKFIQGGIPEDKIAVKPNFVFPAPVPGEGNGNYAIFVGRLSEEKGLRTLLDAWRGLAENVPLKIVGSGPLEKLVKDAALIDPRIEAVGHKDAVEVMPLVGEAAFLIFPSLWYEGMPRTIIEAFAKGTPVIASGLGAMLDMVVDGRNGLQFEAGNSDELANAVRRAWCNTRGLRQMRRFAREDYQQRYGIDRNHSLLMQIYEQSIERKGERRPT